MMLFERARWPPNDSPEVAEAPCCGVRSVVTPGVMTEKLMKFRPLIGRLSICCWPTTVDTEVCEGSTTAPSAVIVISSWPPATFRPKSAVASWPSTSGTPCRVAVAKPCSSALIL